MNRWTRAARVMILAACVSAVTALQTGCGRGNGGAPARAEGELRLATFNVEELAAPMDPSPSSEAHLEAVAKAIRRSDADILALQGVQSLEAVRWFNQTYLSESGYTDIVSLDVGHSRGLENAVLSRVPITNSRVWPTLKIGGKHPSLAGGTPNPNSGKPIRFRRSPLMVQVQLPGERTPITLFIVEHKGGNRFAYWREAEAKAIVRLASDLGMHRRIVVLGSFHAPPDDPSLEAYTEGGFLNAIQHDNGPEMATEASGDTTDLVLANRAALMSLDTANTFVVGLGDDIDGVQTEHFVVVIGVEQSDD
ncbi:MAG: endonuclease/exonuclease/phosphatase family protein [Planctomycetota bacterium]|nr:endonuclease/exonuclease/phosphatase family protein [Planctomycetota bacterium]